MNDLPPLDVYREAAIRDAYNLIANQLDAISKKLDENPPFFSGPLTPDQAVQVISEVILDEYKAIRGSNKPADAKLAYLKPDTKYTYADVIALGMNTLGEYLVAIIPLLEEANQPLEIVLHKNSLKVILLMMRANLERDEFNKAISNPEINIRVTTDANTSYLEVIPGSFLDYFLKATDPEKKSHLARIHSALLSRFNEYNMPGRDPQRMWSIASSLGSIYLYNPELYQSEINSDQLGVNFDVISVLEVLSEDDEVLQSLKDSSDFELFARIIPTSPLAKWLFPDGMPKNPVDRYSYSRFELFGTVSHTKTRFCPAGQSLMQLFSGKFPDNNITVTFIKLFCENVVLDK